MHARSATARPARTSSPPALPLHRGLAVATAGARGCELVTQNALVGIEACLGTKNVRIRAGSVVFANQAKLIMPLSREHSLAVRAGALESANPRKDEGTNDTAGLIVSKDAMANSKAATHPDRLNVAICCALAGHIADQRGMGSVLKWFEGNVAHGLSSSFCG